MLQLSFISQPHKNCTPSTNTQIGQSTSQLGGTPEDITDAHEPLPGKGIAYKSYYELLASHRTIESYGWKDLRRSASPVVPNLDFPQPAAGSGVWWRSGDRGGGAPGTWHSLSFVCGAAGIAPVILICVMTQGWESLI